MNENEIKFPHPVDSWNKPKRRRNLLLWWVIGFLWLFLVFFALVPVGLIWGLLRHNFNNYSISLLGLETNDPFSVIGIFLISLISFKGIVAYALWTEKKWAVELAKIDAAISIAICCLVMTYSLFVHDFKFRLELIVLGPYLYKMNSIEYDWVNFDAPDLISAANPEVPPDI